MNREIMYDQNSLLIIVLLFISILLVYEIFFRVGRSHQKKTDKEEKNQSTTIQAGVMGLLALLLGFTFNMSLERFDSRSYAVIHEANSIGTALLRTKLLPKPYNSEAYELLQKYVDLRIDISRIDLTNESDRNLINAKTDILQNKIWDVATKSAEIDSRPVTTGYYIKALNEVIDARGERDSVLKRHVPEIILFLLFIVLMVGGALIGYTAGLGSKRALVPTMMFTILIVLVVFIIIDLDRPNRSLIRVKHESLQDLKRDNPY